MLLPLLRAQAAGSLRSGLSVLQYRPCRRLVPPDLLRPVQQGRLGCPTFTPCENGPSGGGRRFDSRAIFSTFLLLRHSGPHLLASPSVPSPGQRGPGVDPPLLRSNPQTCRVPVCPCQVPRSTPRPILVAAIIASMGLQPQSTRNFISPGMAPCFVSVPTATLTPASRAMLYTRWHDSSARW